MEFGKSLSNLLILFMLGVAGRAVGQAYETTPPTLTGELEVRAQAGDTNLMSVDPFSFVASGPLASINATLQRQATGTAFDFDSQMFVTAEAVAEANAGFNQDEFILDVIIETTRGSGRAEARADLTFGLLQQRPLPRHYELPNIPGQFFESFNSLAAGVPISTQFAIERSVDMTGGGGTATPDIRIQALENSDPNRPIFQNIFVDGQQISPFETVADGTHDVTFFLNSGSYTTLRLSVEVNAATLPSTAGFAMAQGTVSLFNPTGTFDQQRFENNWFQNTSSPAPDLNETFEVYTINNYAAVSGGYLLQPSLSINTTANQRDFRNMVGVAPQSGQIRSDNGNSFAIARGNALDPADVTPTNRGAIGVLSSANSAAINSADFERARAEAVLVERFHVEAVDPSQVFNGRTRINVNFQLDGEVHLEQRQLTEAINASSKTELDIELYIREANGRMTTLFMDTLTIDLTDNATPEAQTLYDDINLAIDRGQMAQLFPTISIVTGTLIADFDLDLDYDIAPRVLNDSDLTVEMRLVAMSEANFGGAALLDLLNTASFSVTNIEGESVLTPLQPVPEPGSLAVFGLGALAMHRRKWRIQFRSATPGKSLRTSIGVR